MGFWGRIKAFFRSDFAKESDAYHAEARAEQARMITEGKGNEYFEQSARLLGLDADPKNRPKMIFGAHATIETDTKGGAK